jgi:AraC family transcriptional regulator of adaptative response/methylated-DNA-[protein]-cysteine methyltransferase
LTIPAGSFVTYQDMAGYIGRPRAFRAVANAIAINPVAYLIPCHRVIAKSGLIHRYRWGTARKKAMVEWEAAGAR